MPTQSNIEIKSLPGGNRGAALSARRDSTPARGGCARRDVVPLWKRILDIIVIICSLPVVFPVSVGIALLIRCVSKGPVLFRQERVGLNGRPFMCFKFRTMRVDADTSVHEGHLEKLISSGQPMVKMDSHDPRIIPFGSLLRASGLDEIPQLLNVVRGEMSWVGPRPCLPFEAKKYLPWHRERFDALPGLTGLWQVNGKNKTTFDEMICMDIAYARGCNPWLDLKIMIKTVPALLAQMRDSRRRARARQAGVDETGHRARALV